MADNLLDKASILLTPTAYNDGSMLSIKPENGDGDFTFSRSSAATRVNAQGLVENVQIISPELVSNGNFSQIGTEEVSNGNFSQEGSELVTNGDFATDSDWNLENTWTIENGVANGNGANGSAEELTQTNTFTLGKTYKVEYDILNYVSGTIRFQFAGGATLSGTTRSADGTYTEYVVATANHTLLKFKAGSEFYGSIDNVSVKEVGQDWTLGSGWSIGDDKAVANTTGNFVNLYQNSVFVVGKTYKTTFTIVDYTQGKVRLTEGGVNVSGYQNAVGTYTTYFTASQTALYMQGSESFIGSITNISVKEVGQDWTFGTGWSVDQANSKAVHDSSAGATAIQSTSVSVVVGKKYELKYTASNLSGGYIRAEMGGLTPEFNFSDGTYTYNFTATTNANLYITASANVEVTNISVKEITDDTDLPRINYEGFSYQDSLGSEEVVNGDFATDSNWSKSGWSIQNGQAINTASASGNNLYQGSVTSVGGNFKVVITTTITAGSVVVMLGGGSGGYNVIGEATTSGTFTYYGVSNGTDNRILLQTGNGTLVGSVSIDNVSVKEYLGQEVVPDSGCGSWLLEPQSTNLVTYSEDFSQWSVGTGGISIETGYLAPDGSNNATKVTMGSGFSNTALSLNASLGETDSRTIYARTVSGTGQAHLCSFNGNSNNLFDITEQWQRFEVNGTTTPTGSVTFYAVDFRGSSTLTEVVLWGAQAENQSFSTSYIPTSGATNTRLQDIASNSGNATLINSTEGVLYAEIAALADDGTSRQISISDGSYNNALLLRYLDLTNTLQGVFRVGGAFKGSCNFNLSNPIDSIKVAYKYKNSDFALWVNGAEVSTSTDSFSISTETLMELSFDRGDGTQNFYGKAKALAVFKEALTDAELQSLTTI